MSVNITIRALERILKLNLKQTVTVHLLRTIVRKGLQNILHTLIKSYLKTKQK